MKNTIRSFETNGMIREAISEDNIPEKDFVVLDRNIIFDEFYTGIMGDISSISKKMKWVEDYDNYATRKFEYPFAYLAARVVSGMRVLDAGCSVDPFAPFLAKHGLDTYGVDNFYSHDVPWDPENGIFEGKLIGIEKIHEYSKQLKLRLGIQVDYFNQDMTSTEFDNQFFDRIFCISVLEHLPSYKIKLAFDEWRRLLKEDGFVVLTTDYISHGRQNFNIGDVIEKVGFTLVGKVSILSSHQIPPNNSTEDPNPTIVAGFVVKPQPSYKVPIRSKVYRQHRFIRFTIDQTNKGLSHLKRSLLSVTIGTG
jgi:SAM-dependent methyltransferase